MAYNNFKPIFWSKYILDELEKKAVLVNRCWREFEGQAKKGEKVKILGLGDITIGDYTGADIGAPETIADASTYLEITQAKFFNFCINDIDKAQTQGNVMDKLMSKVAHKMALERDSFVATMAKHAGNTDKDTVVQITKADDAKKAIDKALLWLRENDVQLDDDVSIEIPPFVYQLLKDKYIELDTNNSTMLANGQVGKYDNAKIIISNNLYNDGTGTYCMVRTPEAIAFAGGIDSMEPYRPEGNFQDAIKGLNTFGATVVYPKQLYALKVSK